MLASVTTVAAPLKQAIFRCYKQATAAALAYGAEVADFFPVFEAMLELCVRYRDSSPLDDAFVWSIHAAVKNYNALFSPFVQESAGLFVYSLLRALHDELFVVVPFLTAPLPVVVPEHKRRSGAPPVPLFVAVAARLAWFVAPLVLLVPGALEDARSAGVEPDLVPLSALLSSPAVCARIGPTSSSSAAVANTRAARASASAAACAEILRCVAQPSDSSGALDDDSDDAISAARMASYVLKQLGRGDLTALHVAGLRALEVGLRHTGLDPPSHVLARITHRGVAAAAGIGVIAASKHRPDDEGVSGPVTQDVPAVPSSLLNDLITACENATLVEFLSTLRFPDDDMLLALVQSMPVARVALFVESATVQVLPLAKLWRPTSTGVTDVLESQCRVEALRQMAAFLLATACATSGAYPAGLVAAAAAFSRLLVSDLSLQVTQEVLWLGAAQLCVGILTAGRPGSTELTDVLAPIAAVLYKRAELDLPYVGAYASLISSTQCALKLVDFDAVAVGPYLAYLLRLAACAGLHAVRAGRELVDCLFRELSETRAHCRMLGSAPPPPSGLPEHLLHGFVSRSKYCPHCKHWVSTHADSAFTPVIALDLPRIPRSAGGADRPHNLVDLLSMEFYSTRPFTEKYACSSCRERTPKREPVDGSREKVLLVAAPVMLTIDILRWAENSDTDAKECILRPDVLLYPHELDISPFCVGAKPRTLLYDLYSFTCFHSDVASAGHYTCFVRNFHPSAREGWCLVNDSVPTARSTDEVLAAVDGHHVTQLCYVQRPDRKSGAAPDGGGLAAAAGGASAAPAAIDISDSADESASAVAEVIDLTDVE